MDGRRGRSAIGKRTTPSTRDRDRTLTLAGVARAMSVRGRRRRAVCQRRLLAWLRRVPIRLTFPMPEAPSLVIAGQVYSPAVSLYLLSRLFRYGLTRRAL